VTSPGSKQNRKRAAAIAALLTQGTVADAAKVAGLGEKTLRRWMAAPGFTAEYALARQRVIEGAVGALQQASAEAVATLRRNLTAGVPSVEVRAALGIITQAFRGAELLDLAQRIAALEDLQRRPLPWVSSAD
jgi:transposase-like protein